MPQVKPIQNNFSGGEWSPKLESRVDLAKYFNACKTLENFIIMPHGGVYRRPGLHYVAAVKNHTRKVRLIPFEFNVEQAYILEFGHQYMRFYKNHGQILTNADSYTKLLLHMDGVDASTTFVDSGVTVHTVTPHGTAQLDTDYKVFGSASGLFDGVNAYLTIPYHADFDLSGGVWTVDFRIRPISPAVQTIFEKITDGSNYIRVWIDAYRIWFSVTTAGSGFTTFSSSLLPASSWSHVAIGESGNSYLFFINGALVGSNSNAVRPVASGPLSIGKFNGHLDEFRISKGVARWTANFSPPSQQYPLPGETGAVEIAAPTYPYLEEDLATIKKTQSADVMYLVHPNYEPRKLSRTSHTNWTLNVIDFIDGPYRDEETDIIFTPSGVTGNITLSADADFFRADQIGDFLRLKFSTPSYNFFNSGNPNDVPSWIMSGCTMDQIIDGGQDDDYFYRLTEDTSGGTQTAIRELALTVGTYYEATVYIKDGTGTWADGKLQIINNAETTIIAEYPLASQADWTKYKVVFQATEVNNKLRLYSELVDASDTTINFDVVSIKRVDSTGTESWGYVEITGFTDEQNANATVKSELGIGNSVAYREAAWSTYRGWPTAVMFHEERLWFARDLTYWGSKKGEGQYEIFTPGDTDEDPVSFTLNSDRVNLIRWMASAKRLIIGTAGEEFTTDGGDTFITATNVNSKSVRTHGSADIEPLKIDNAVIFLQKAGRKLREIVYSFEIESYVAPDMTILAEHITAPKILALNYQQEPESLIWALRSDGVLLSLTYMRTEDIVGWVRHITDGEFESIACIPNPDGSADELWVAIKRTIGGVTKRYIEYLDPNINVDSALVYSGAPVTSVSGLSHLNGKTVKVVGDGMVYEDVVAGGMITLSPAFAASEIQVGLPYTSKLETMRPEVSLGNGTSRGMKKAWGDCFVTLLASGGLTINGEVVPFRKASDILGQALPLFTGDKRVNQLGWDRNQGRVVIEQAQALPCMVLSIFGDLEIGG